MRHKFWLPVAGSILLLCVCASLVSGQKAKPRLSPLEIADRLDQLVQPRFLLDAGKFGTERLLAIAGHEQDHEVYNLTGQTKKEKNLLHTVNSAKRDYALGFVHCAHKPGKFLPKSKTNQGSVTESDSTLLSFDLLVLRANNRNLNYYADQEAEDWDKQYGERVNKAVQKALPRLKRGQFVEVRTEDIFVAMRPVKASRQACLNCHRGAKKNDALGIMVYIVGNSPSHRFKK